MINNYDSVVSQNSSGATILQKQNAASYAYGRRNRFSFVLTFLMLFSFVFAQGQTILISPTGDGGFENGATLGSNNWTAVNSSTDSWIAGATPIASAGARCAFISSTPSTSQTWTYSQTNVVQHIYYDVTIPAGESVVNLSFKWKAGGEGSSSDWDNLKVFWGPVDVIGVPTADTQVNSTFRIGTWFNLSSTSYNTSTNIISGMPGTTYRLVFSWKSDSADILNPPSALDEISLISRAPGNFVSVATGNWNTPGTWDANAVPTAFDNAIVSTGHIVTADIATTSIKDLIVNGTLAYATACTNIAVTGDLTVASGGLVNVFTGTTGKTLTVAGNITNNGRIDVSVGATSAGALTLNGSTVQTVAGTGTFGGTITSTTTTNTANVIRNLIINNTSTAIPNVIWSFNDVKVAYNLTLTSAKINLGTNKLTFGNYAAGNTLTASGSNGILPGGKFSRWWTATVLGTSVTAGTDPTNGTSRYPLISASGAPRTMYISRTNSTSAVAGELAVVYADATTITTGLSINDGAYTITDRYDGNWSVTNEGTPVSASSYTLVLFANNALYPSNGNTRIMGASTALSGTHQNGTTTPGAQRITVSQTDLLAAPLYLGIATTDIPFVSVANGDWNATSTWNKGATPTCADNVIIASGHTVNVNTLTNVAKGVTITSGGSLVIASGDLTVGCTLNNTTLLNNGTLTVTGGEIKINGNYLGNSGSTLNQSGGDINVDGNAAGVTANSVASGTHIFSHTASAVSNLNLTAGRITIVDPHANTSSSDYAFRVSQGGAYNSATASHTLRFGDGVSNDNGGNATYGFYYYLYPGSYYFGLGNLEINAGTTGTNRWVYNGTTYLNGNINIVSGELRQSGSSITCPGNITNEGVYTNATTLTLGQYNGTATVASTNAQTISGSGVFRNLATSPTANLTSLTVNNSNAIGVTLNVPLSVSGTLNMTSGIINTTNTNLLTLGTATAAGTLLGTPSATNMVKGPFQRTIASGNAATNYISFPVGKSTYAPIAIAPVTTAVSVVKAEVFDSNTGTLNPSIVNMTTSKRWEAPIVSGTVTGVNVRLFDSGILATSIPVQAASAAGEYTNSFGSVATAAAGASTESNTPLAFPDYTGFLSYADSNACSGTPTPGNTIASTNAICLGTSVTLSLQNVTSGTGVTYQWKSSTDGITYTAITGATNATLTVTPTASLYYVCDVTCANSASTTTSTAVQVTFSTSVTGTTPGTRCGTGTVVLGATGSTGTTVKWYSAITGGTALGTGITFTTPSIAATTTYYAGAESASPGVVSIGSNSSTSSTSGITPYTSIYEGSRIQYLVTAADLTSYGLTAGAITSLGFKITSSGAGTTPQSGFTIKVAQVSNASISTFLTPTFETVYGPVSEPAPAVGNKIYTFSSPVNWDGTSSLLIEICHDNDPNATCPSCYSGNSTVAVSTTTYNSVYGRYVDNAAACGSATAGSAVSTFTSRPDFIINGQVACQSARVPVVATVTPPPALTLSATSATICESESAPVVTVTSTIGDYDSYVWTPALGVSGDQNIGWTFNPAVSTVYTLTATQSSGSLCSTTANFAVTVNPRPEVITIAPASINTCLDTSVALTATGGLERSNAYGATMEVLPSELVVSSNATATLNTSYYAQGSSSVRFNTTTSATATYSLNQNIDLTGAESAQVVFSHIAAFEGSTNSYDYGFVEYSTDGGTTWTSFAPENYSGSAANTIFNTTAVRFTTRSYADWISTFSSSTSTPGASPATSLWKTETFTIPAAALTSSQFRIRFRYTTDSSTNYYGWLIDDVKVIKSREHITWTPITNLYTDAAATTAYTAGTSARTVYFKSNVVAPAVTYSATASTLAGCSRTASTEVTVNALPTVVTVNPAAVCSPATVDLTVASVTNGSDAGLTFTYWTDLAATNALADPSAVSTSGTYYIKGTNTIGCSAVTSVVVTVHALPVLTITNPAAVCSPATVDLAAAAITAGSDSGLTFTYWSDSAATLALSSAVVTASGTYYIKAVNANGCETIMPVVVTVTNTDAPTGVATQAFCGSASMVDLVVTGTDVKWYTAATGGTQYPTALLANIGLSNGSTYYASQTLNGCESTTRFAVTVTLNPVPTAPTAAAQTFCTAATVADLFPNGAAYSWYADATGGTALVSTDALTSGTYYVSQTINGCESTRTAVTVTISTTVAPTAADQSFCGSALVANLVASGTNLNWYAAATGGSALVASTALTSTTYYVSQTVDGCESARTAVLVTITNTTAPTASAQTFCFAGTVADLVATGTNLNWYDVASGGTALATTTHLTSGIYYVSQTVSGCESARTAVNVTISSPATPVGATTQTIFGDFATDATIEDINVSGNGIVWYATAQDAANGTNPLAPGTQLENGQTYYAVSVVGTCRSAALAVTVTVTLEAAHFDSNALQYYPNPTRDVVHVQYSNAISHVRVINLLGQVVIDRKEQATSIQVDLSGFAAGTYIVEVASQDAIKQFKVVKSE